MDKLKEYQHLRKETEKLNNFLFGPFLYEQSLKETLNQDSIYTKNILNLASSCDQKIKRYIGTNYPNKTLHKK